MAPPLRMHSHPISKHLLIIISYPFKTLLNSVTFLHRSTTKTDILQTKTRTWHDRFDLRSAQWPGMGRYEEKANLGISESHKIYKHHEKEGKNLDPLHLARCSVPEPYPPQTPPELGTAISSTSMSCGLRGLCSLGFTSSGSSKGCAFGTKPSMLPSGKHTKSY